MFANGGCSWTSILKNIIRSSFKDFGKGWFNLQESSWDAYCASKMKRFLRMVRYMMEDSVRYLVEDTLARYCNFVERHCGSPIVDVIDIDCVNTTWPQSDHKVCSINILFHVTKRYIKHTRCSWCICINHPSDTRIMICY